MDIAFDFALSRCYDLGNRGQDENYILFRRLGTEPVVGSDVDGIVSRVFKTHVRDISYKAHTFWWRGQPMRTRY